MSDRFIGLDVGGTKIASATLCDGQLSESTLVETAIDAARAVVFLVIGAGKADIVARLFGDSPDGSLPAARVRPRYGSLTVILDEAAAAKL